MAQAVAEAAIRRRGWEHVAIASAGVSAVDGSLASEFAVRAAAESGHDLGGHRARLLTADQVLWADLILGMSEAHISAIDELGGGEKAFLITEFVAGEGAGKPVEDPFGGDEERYRSALAQIEVAVEDMLDRIRPILSP